MTCWQPRLPSKANRCFAVIWISVNVSMQHTHSCFEVIFINGLNGLVWGHFLWPLVLSRAATVSAGDVCILWVCVCMSVVNMAKCGPGVTYCTRNYHRCYCWVFCWVFICLSCDSATILQNTIRTFYSVETEQNKEKRLTEEGSCSISTKTSVLLNKI